jgi:hypothetical protein
VLVAWEDGRGETAQVFRRGRRCGLTKVQAKMFRVCDSTCQDVRCEAASPEIRGTPRFITGQSPHSDFYPAMAAHVIWEVDAERHKKGTEEIIVSSKCVAACMLITRVLDLLQ